MSCWTRYCIGGVPCRQIVVHPAEASFVPLDPPDPTGLSSCRNQDNRGRARPVHSFGQDLPPPRTGAPSGVECFLEKQEVAPGEAFLQRLTEEVGRMKRRHRTDRAAARVEVAPLATKLEDALR